MAEITQAQTQALKKKRTRIFIVIFLLCALCFVAYLVLKRYVLCNIDGANEACMLEVSPQIAYLLTSFLPQLGNSGVVLSLIWYFGWPAIEGMVAKRHESLERDFVESAKIKAQAEAESKDVNEKLARLNAEVENMKRNYQEAADNECSQIAQNADATLERLKQNAQTAFDLQSNVATSAFQKEMMHQAIDQAQLEISNKLATDASLRNQLIDQSIASLQL